MTRATSFFAVAVAVASVCNGVAANCLDDQVQAGDRDTTMVICCDESTPKTIPDSIGDLTGLERM
jgi:hypothetical protein